MTACGLTVLRATGAALATKAWRWSPALQEWSKRSYQAGAWFTPEELTVGSLPDLAAALEKLSRDPRAFIVRGELAQWARDGLAADPEFRIRRRKHKKNDVEPTLLEVPRRWLMIDIDNFPLPGWADLADDPETAIAHAIEELLPEEFQGADYFWQLSASAGFSQGMLKAHLFFWLTAPASNAHLKAVLEQHAPGVDRAPFSAAQPHFIAAPVVEGGYDPLPRRTGWRKGLERAVTLPEPRPEERKPRPGGTGATGRAGGVMDALAFLGHDEGGQGFHAPLRAAILRYARDCNRYGGRDDEALKEQLRAAIRSAPCRPGGNVETPYCQDYYLDSSIAGAFALLSADPDIQTMRPHHKAPQHTIEEARVVVAEHVEAFLGRALAWHRLGDEARRKQPAEHSALVVDVGVGKSTAARNGLATFIEASRAAGSPHRVLWLVPTHRLGGEAFAALTELGINVAVWRGREAAEPGTADPEADVPAMPMCRNLPAVNDAVAIGEDVERAVCGSGKEGERSCPFRAECAYQRQKASAAAADVVVAAHQALFHRLPQEVGRGLGLIVIDEAWWQAGLLPNRTLRLASFAEEPLLHPVRKDDESVGRGSKKRRVERHEEDTQDLATLSAKAQEALAAAADGELVSREAALAAGLTADECAHAAKLEWRRKLEGAIQPGMSLAARKEAMEMAAGNASIPRRVGVWKALEELLRGNAAHTGRLQLGTKGDADGAARVILLHSRMDVRESITGLPILALDATMPVEVVRHYLPRLNVLAEVQAAAPYVRVHQIVGGWGKTSLCPSDKAAPEENRRRANLVAELADFVRLHGGEDAVAITYKDIEDRFAAPGVRTGHFNAIAGLDEFRDARTLFSIGRPLPRAPDLRALALALTGKPIPADSGQVETRGALMADGTGRAINVRTYADPDLEALRGAIVDAGVTQTCGRGRGVNRNAGSPLDVFVLADVVMPVPVTTLVRWEEVRPGVLARMLARGSVLLSPTDAAKAYPDLFPSAEGARKAIDRELKGRDFPDIPLRGISLGECPGNSPVLVAYRPTGRGQQTRHALALPTRLPGLRAWLETLVGPLSHFAVGAGPPPDPAGPDPQAPPPVVRPVPPDPEPASAELDTGGDVPPAWAREVIPVDAYAVATMDADPDDFDPWPRFQPSSHPPWMSAGWAGPAAHIAR